MQLALGFRVFKALGRIGGLFGSLQKGEGRGLHTPTSPGHSDTTPEQQRCQPTTPVAILQSRGLCCRWAGTQCGAGLKARLASKLVGGQAGRLIG